jgi:hypothetical protein
MKTLKLTLLLALIIIEGCATTNKSSSASDIGWVSGGKVLGIKGFWSKRIPLDYWYKSTKTSLENSFIIKVDGKHLFDRGARSDILYQNAIPDQAVLVCGNLFGTSLKQMTTLPKDHPLGPTSLYPELISGTCYSKSEYAEQIASQQKLRKQTIEKQERERIALQERQAQLVIDKLKLKQEDCTSFGFKPESTEHADCVMKLTIAERQQQKDAAATARLASLRRAQLAQQQEADSKAAEQEKRRRDGALLMGIGGNISAGKAPLDFSTPKESTSAKDSIPSGYKNCRYRVGGGIISITISNAQVCASTRQFDGNLGYLTQ